MPITISTAPYTPSSSILASKYTNPNMLLKNDYDTLTDAAYVIDGNPTTFATLSEPSWLFNIDIANEAIIDLGSVYQVTLLTFDFSSLLTNLSTAAGNTTDSLLISNDGATYYTIWTDSSSHPVNQIRKCVGHSYLCLSNTTDVPLGIRYIKLRSNSINTVSGNASRTVKLYYLGVF